MKIQHIFLFIIVGLLCSCSNADLQKRQDSYNDAYFNLQDRREIRQDAREARDDARWDRIMH